MGDHSPATYPVIEPGPQQWQGVQALFNVIKNRLLHQKFWASRLDTIFLVYLTRFSVIFTCSGYFHLIRGGVRRLHAWRQCVVNRGQTRHLRRIMTKPIKWRVRPAKTQIRPGHLPSLIRVFAVRLKKARTLSYPLSTQGRLIRLARCPGWSESSLGAHAILLVLSRCGSFLDRKYFSVKLIK